MESDVWKLSQVTQVMEHVERHRRARARHGEQQCGIVRQLVQEDLCAGMLSDTDMSLPQKKKEHNRALGFALLAHSHHPFHRLAYNAR